MTATPAHDVDEHGRPEPPSRGDETATLLGFLDYQRATFAWKTRGLDAIGLGVRVAASSMTLGGMLKHLAYVEDDWFTETMMGRPRPEPWASAPWDEDRDWEWHSAATDTPEQLRTLWEASVERSRRVVDEALAEGDLGQIARADAPGHELPSLRWIIVHMIEEYARHNGHADLIRESIDGETGE
ncbi:MAG TPA: DinB family protein [Thermomicrobiales bacterium]|jgi:uncharacterized damage-inducible protein DinB|nr:DinB family protein [Thermomicrobiales bacterium]